LDRTILPIPEPLRQPSTERHVRNATLPPRFEVTAPKDAPNVLLVLIDDLGFAGTSTFGGPVPTPVFDRIARSGLKFNNFHTTDDGPDNGEIVSGVITTPEPDPRVLSSWPLDTANLRGG
jgi:hypothetical protein